MAQRFTRLLSVVAAGGVLSATLLAGAGAATAAPTLATKAVSASCGDSVTVQKGDTVTVTGLLGKTVSKVVSSSGTVGGVLGGVLCQVRVTVVQPVASAAASAVPPLKPVTGAAAGAPGSVLAPGASGSGSGSGAAPTTDAAPAPSSAATANPSAAPTSSAAPAPAVDPQVAAAMAPAFAPLFATLPASFLSSALTTGSGATVASFGGAYDAGMLFGSAFPALRAGVPFSAGYDAANAVTSTSQLQALPVDGLGRGLGVPVVLAVLLLSGMAAFAVRRMVLGRAAALARGRDGSAADVAGSVGAPGGTATA